VRYVLNPSLSVSLFVGVCWLFVVRHTLGLRDCTDRMPGFVRVQAANKNSPVSNYQGFCACGYRKPYPI
jgi:hypothetical protein